MYSRLLAAPVGDVGLGEVVGVEGVERGPDLVLDEPGNLVFPHELGVDRGDVPGSAEVAIAGEFVGGQEGVDGAIAVAMEVQRDVKVVDLLDHLLDGIFREGELTAPVLLAAGAAGEVGGGEVGGFALGRAVDGDFDAADLEVIVVLAPGAGGVCLEHLVEVGDEGIRDDVDDMGATGGGPFHELDLARVGGPLVRSGDTCLSIEHLPGPAPRDLFLPARLRQRCEHRQVGRFHDQAPGLVRAGLADDDTAGGCFRVGGDVELFERCRVHDSAVH